MTALPAHTDYTQASTQGGKKNFMTNVRAFLAGVLGEAGDRIYQDIIAEQTPGAGVTVDGVLLKDGGIALASGQKLAPGDGGTGIEATLSAADYGRTLQVGYGGAAFELGGPPIGLRNFIINGAFDVWQRGVDFQNVDGYGPDRWVCFNRAGAGGSGSFTQQPFPVGQTDVPGGPTYFGRLTQSTGVASPLVGGEQRIEDVTRLAGREVTLSFWARADTAASLHPSYRQDFGSGGSTAVTGGLGTMSLTTSWQRFTITSTLPGVAGKTVGGGNFLALQFDMPASWTGHVDLANVQLEAGPSATPFERRPIGIERLLCQRYCQKSYNPDTPPGNAVHEGIVIHTHGEVTSGGGWNVWIPVRFGTPMRVGPSIAYWDRAGNSGRISTWTPADTETDNQTPSGLVIGAGCNGFAFRHVAAQGVSATGFHWLADAEL